MSFYPRSPRWASPCHSMTRKALARFLALCLVFECLAVVGCSSATTNNQGPVFYPALPERPRYQFLFGFTTEEDLVGKSSFEEFLLGKEEETRALRKPYGVALWGSKLYIADTGLRRVVVVDLADKAFETLLGDAGPGKVEVPINISVTPDGHKWVADAGRGQVLQYDAKDGFVRAYGKKGQFKPTDVAVFGDYVYVCDVGDQEIEVLSRQTGAPLFKFGRPGSDPGSFSFPTNLTVDGQGNVYVSDTGNFRIQKFDPKGKLLGKFGEVGDAPGTFTRPKGIDVDPDGRIYVVDAAFENVQVFDQEFRLLIGLGGPGLEPGNLYLPADVDITLDKAGIFKPYVDPRLNLRFVVLVVSQYGPRRINAYGYGDWTGPEQDSPPPEAPAAQPTAPAAPALAPEPGTAAPALAPEPGTAAPAVAAPLATEQPAGDPD